MFPRGGRLRVPRIGKSPAESDHLRLTQTAEHDHWPSANARSATRHGVSHERSRYGFEHAGADYPGLELGSDAVFCFGDAQNGLPLEVGFLYLPGDDVLIIHAMELRTRKYGRQYQESIPWRR